MEVLTIICTTGALLLPGLRWALRPLRDAQDSVSRHFESEAKVDPNA